MTNKSQPDYSKLDGQSYFPQDEFIVRLKQDFPQVFTEGQIDPSKLKANLKNIVELGETYGLTWKGKSNVFSVIQSTITKTLHPARDESVNFDTTDNLFIEGDNLDALKILQRSYYGKIKMIYIDPPYNTGNDFVYNDHFQQDKEDYDRESGKRNEAGYLTSQTALQKNTKDSGHYHSNWLNMMYPRLYLARNLLRNDGVIFISIDDNEVHNLRLIMNEIFGEENFFGQITWQNRTKPKNIGDSKYSLQQNIEYVLVYGKIPSDQFNFLLPETSEKIYPEVDNDGEYRLEEIQQRKNLGSMRRDSMVYELLGVLLKENYRWQLSPDKKNELISKSKLIKKGERVYKKIYKSEETGFSYEPFWSHRSDTGTAESAKEELEVLMGTDDIFDTVKPLNLIKQLLYFLPNDILIFDFFAGSGTTAHAVMDLNAQDDGNRKWICVQLDEKTDEGSEAYKASHKTISDIAKERIRRAGKKIGKGDIGFKVLKVGETNLKIWDSTIKDPAKLQKQMELMQNVVKDGVGGEDLLLELMIKSGVAPTAKREKIGEYWNIGDGSLIICLAKAMTEEIWSSILKLKPQKLIFLDSSLAGNDQLKTNLILKAEKEKIEVVVV